MKRFALSTLVAVSTALPAVAGPLTPAWVKLFSSEGSVAYVDINRITRQGADSYVVYTTLGTFMAEEVDVRVEVNCKNWMLKLGTDPAESNPIIADEYCQIIRQYSR